MHNPKDYLEEMGFKLSGAQEVPHGIFCEHTSHMDGYTLPEIRRYATDALAAMAEYGVETTDKDRVQILEDCVIMMDTESLMTLGEMLSATPAIWLQVAEMAQDTFDSNYDLWLFESKYLCKVNAVRAKAGAEPLTKEDPEVVKIIAVGLRHHFREDQPGKIRELLAGYDNWDFFAFVTALHAANLDELTLVRKGSVEATEPLAALYVDSIYRRNLTKDQIFAELDEHGLRDSPLIGWNAIKAVAEYEWEYREEIYQYPASFFEPSRGETFLRFVRLTDLFEIADIRTNEPIRRVAQSFMEDSYTVNANKTLFACYGYSLRELAQFPPAELEELPEPSFEELAALE